jgi:carbonic anhydrase
LDAIPDAEARHRRLVELNVIEQCLNLFKTGVVQRQRLETFSDRSNGLVDIDYTTPRVHACVFDPNTGDMKRLPIDFRAYIDDLGDIYDLYTIDGDKVPTKPQKQEAFLEEVKVAKVNGVDRSSVSQAPEFMI